TLDVQFNSSSCLNNDEMRTMKESQQQDIELSSSSDEYSTWGNPRNSLNVDVRTKEFYSNLLTRIINFKIIVLVALTLVVLAQVAYIAVKRNFEQLVFDDGSSTPCIYNPLTKTFRQ
ncbi:TPA: hypothetical protein ACGC5K_002449, partial [Acinetobacter baumannii]